MQNICCKGIVLRASSLFFTFFELRPLAPRPPDCKIGAGHGFGWQQTTSTHSAMPPARPCRPRPRGQSRRPRNLHMNSRRPRDPVPFKMWLSRRQRHNHFYSEWSVIGICGVSNNESDSNCLSVNFPRRTVIGSFRFINQSQKKKVLRKIKIIAKRRNGFVSM